MKKTALICVTRNNAEKLQKTLNSIIRNTNTEHYDLFIIDNASSDSTLGIYQLPVLADNITIVRSGKNLNWVGGINLGIEMTKGYQYVGFLDDDIEVCPNWLENFIDVLISNRKVAAVGPVTSNSLDWQGYDNLKICYRGWGLPDLVEINRSHVSAMYEHIKKNGAGVLLHGNLSFFCILLTRGAVDKVGSVDSGFIDRLKFFDYKLALSTKTYVLSNYRNNYFSCKNIKLNPKAFHLEKICLINLDRRWDRLERFYNYHPELKNEVVIISAFDGKKLRLTKKMARLFAPNQFHWNKATIGCMLSHLKIWTELAENLDDNCLYFILEDDTKLTNGWKKVLDQSILNGDIPLDCDVLYFGGVLPKNEYALKQVKQIVNKNIYKVNSNTFFSQKTPNNYFHFGAYAYLLTAKGARKLLNAISLQSGIWDQADYLLGGAFPDFYPNKLNHYFYDPFLAHCYQDLEPGFQKSYSESASEEPKKIDSDIWKESACFDESIAKSMVDVTEPYDISGALEEARKQMQVPSNTQNVKISLLHATRGRPIHALDARELWLNKAKFPERVEHLFAIDHDDAESIVLKQHPHVIQPQDGYSVGAWNLAASKCAGDVLIQLSDDWLPPDGWDELIASRLNTDCEEVLWIDDGNRTDDLMCMAITTRKYYLRHGLFDPVFKNVYSDNDFTLRAKKAGAVVDARDIKIGSCLVGK